MGAAGKAENFTMNSYNFTSDVVLNTVTVLLAVTIGLPCYLGGWYIDCTFQLLSSMLKKETS